MNDQGERCRALRAQANALRLDDMDEADAFASGLSGTMTANRIVRALWPDVLKELKRRRGDAP